MLCREAGAEFSRRIVSHRRPDSLCSLTLLLVAKLRPKSDAASLVRSSAGEPALSEVSTSLAEKLAGATATDALALLGVARIVAAEEGGVELVDDEDVRGLLPGSALTVHWAEASATAAHGDRGDDDDDERASGSMLLRQRR